jgi:putative redox protein
MQTSKVIYLGNLRTEATHLLSGTKIITDAPLDNNGKGEAFSPTDLVATAYASCLFTIIGIYCQNHKIHFEFAEAKITKTMASNPRRIEKIKLELDFSKNNWSNELQKKILEIGKACPVGHTLSEEVKIEFIL